MVLAPVLSVLVLYCLVLLFRRRRTFPRMFIVQVWLIAAVHILAVLLTVANLRVSQGFAIEVTFAIWSAALAIIGTLYMLRSERVRNTFTL